MRPPLVIGIAGKARTGKDTLASFIQAQYGGYQYSFAEPIRSMLRAGFNVDLASPYWAERKEQPIPALCKSPRELLQTLGTEWGRKTVHPDVWVILARGALNARGPGMIVTDIRFENEAAWVRSMQGVVIHVERGNAPTVNPHSSEDGVIQQPQDIKLFNNGSLEDLQFAVSKLFHP